MLDIFLMRHGEASFNADSDINRELTVRGQSEVRRAVKGLSEQFGSVDQVWSSPYLRAKQSAQIAIEELGGRLNIQQRLTPDYNPSKVAEWLYQLDGEASSVLIASHMPLVGKLVSLMVNADLLHPVSFGTGMIVRLTAESPFDGCFTARHIEPLMVDNNQ
ncbi:phosphohistidine phosphatase SixA [Alkalimarinus coralli]|uniref:phosphohistidine phosphatase SixA n=1 Tax=Alkalimarinus coralli TaxID=2935863 RepID=UPI00202B4DF1|nr:phosphohistidine phosphatase SixA [Alkalimarinus coralli]